MPRLVACPSCNAHVKRADATCPHCGASMHDPAGSVRRTAGAVLMGLSIASTACVAEPEYGVPATESDTNQPGTGSTSGTDDTTSESTTGTTDSTDSVGEPEYGVPETDSVGEPDYGVPETTG